MDRDFKGVWIPKKIWLSKDMNIQCKVLLTEIDSLSSTNLGCIADNDYFASFLGVSDRQVKRYIKQLKELGYIEVIDSGRPRRIISLVDRVCNGDIYVPQQHNEDMGDTVVGHLCPDSRTFMSHHQNEAEELGTDQNTPKNAPINTYINKYNIINNIISADAENGNDCVTESKLDESENNTTAQPSNNTTSTSLDTTTIRSSDLTISVNDIWNAYQIYGTSKGKLNDLEKKLKGKSQEELKQVLLEARLRTCEFKYGLCQTINGRKVACTCANMVDDVKTDEELIINRVEEIINSHKIYKYRSNKFREEWELNINNWFKDYTKLAKPAEPQTERERILLYDELASKHELGRLKEWFPKYSFTKVEEKWLMRCAKGRK